jgi:O-antigen/teichoic acid export membrane protein
MKFKELRFSFRAKMSTVKSFAKFMGWNTLTSISDIGYQQGSAIILNIFHGVTLNATMGIANQVKSAVFSFTRSVQMAANPQIIKSYANGALTEFNQLFCRISRISFYLILFLGLPLMVNTEFILDLWLTVIPPSAVIFVRLMLVFCILDSLTGPLWVTIQAAGQLKYYQIVISVVWLLSLPATYIAFSYGLPSYWVLLVLIITDSSLLGVRVYFTQLHCGYRCTAYVKEVLVPIARVLVVSSALAALPMLWLDGVALFFVSSTLSCVAVTASIYFGGLTPNERRFANEFIKKKLGR